ncbi:Uncharacterised protein [Streptococcus pneumoniae]|nr:Uncharacterised protein [Streptococcus pneumoniae]
MIAIDFTAEVEKRKEDLLADLPYGRGSSW